MYVCKHVKNLFSKDMSANEGGQGWGAEAGCFLVLWAGAGWEKKQEPEPQKNMTLLYRLLEDKKHKEIVH